ncbi:MAG: hypothetical protein V8S96_00455 [Lachnospiraceae bacterium]
MGNMRAGKRICQSNLKRILGNVRFYLALAWFAMTLCFYMLQLRALAAQLELPVHLVSATFIDKIRESDVFDPWSCSAVL